MKHQFERPGLLHYRGLTVDVTDYSYLLLLMSVIMSYPSVMQMTKDNVSHTVTWIACVCVYVCVCMCVFTFKLAVQYRSKISPNTHLLHFSPLFIMNLSIQPLHPLFGTFQSIISATDIKLSQREIRGDSTSIQE